MGSRVEIKEQANETREVIALSYSPTKANAIVVDIKTRKKKTVHASKLNIAGFKITTDMCPAKMIGQFHFSSVKICLERRS